MAGEVAFGEYPPSPGQLVRNSTVNAGDPASQMISLLQRLADRLAPPPYESFQWFNSLAINAVQYDYNNTSPVNGMIFCLTAGAVDVYIDGIVSGHPFLSQVGAGAFYIPFTARTPQKIAFVSSGIVPAVGSVVVMCY